MNHNGVNFFLNSVNSPPSSSPSSPNNTNNNNINHHNNNNNNKGHAGVASALEQAAEAAIGRQRLPIHNLLAFARALNATNALGRTRRRRRDSAIPLPLADSVANVDQLVYQSRVVMSDQPYDALVANASMVSAASVLSTITENVFGLPSGPASAPPLALKLHNKAKWKQAANKTTLTPKIVASSRTAVSAGSNASPGSTSTRRPSKSFFLGNDLPGHTSYDAETDPIVNLEARISCAKSLYKLSCHEGNEMAMIQGQSISQIADFSDVEHVKLQEVCAAILANLTTHVDCLDAFVAHDGISALLELSWSQSIDVKLLCAIALCRLSLHRSYAVIMGKSKAIIEFCAMLAIPHEELQRICVSCLMNLLFYGQPLTERVFTGDTHATQSRLGVMNVVSQLAGASCTMRFATGVLFNLSLYRVSAVAALRSSASEILHMITTHVCKVGLYPSFGAGCANTMTSSNNSRSPSRVDPKILQANQTAMFRLISDSLANYSSYSEYIISLSSYGIKTLTLLLHTLRDKPIENCNLLMADEAVRIVGGSCARVFANFSALEDLRKTVFHEETVLLASKLLLLSPQSFANPRAFYKNAIRTIANLSFHDTCTKYFMLAPALLELVHATATRVTASATTTTSTTSKEDSVTELDPDHNPMLLIIDDEMVEDALATILNLAANGNYTAELLACLDGKLLAKAADQQPSVKLKYSYCIVFCNLVFDLRLRPIVAGDWAVHTLVSGFFSSECDSDEDKERFLAALFYIANTIEQPDNIKQLVQVVSSCLRTPMLMVNGHRETQSQVQLQPNANQSNTDQDKSIVNPSFEYFGAAILYSIASSAAHDSRQKQVELLLDPSNGDIEQTLVDLSSRSSTSHATRAFCAATLYHICAASHASTRILQALVEICNLTENVHMLLACAASFANVSFTPEGRQLLLNSTTSIAKAFTKLGRTCDVECQQYAAIAACNVSTCACIWSLDELKDFVVVALLRANSARAKQIHARTLYNLLSHAKSRAQLVEDGVLYALMKLAHVQSASNTAEVDSIMRLGYQTLYNLSCDRAFHTKLLQNGVVQYLLTCIRKAKGGVANGSGSGGGGGGGGGGNSGKESLHYPPSHHNTTARNHSPSHSHHSHESGRRASHSPPKGAALLASSSTAADGTFRLSLKNRRLGVGILANLSAFEENHKDLMDAQLTDVLHKYCDHDVETRACVTITLRNLSCHQPWVELLSERKTLILLLSLSGSSSKLVQRFAIETLANCSLVNDAMHLFNELHVVRIVLTLLEDDPPEQETCLAALKLLHNLAFDDTLAMDLIEHRALERVRVLSKLEHVTTAAAAGGGAAAADKSASETGSDNESASESGSEHQSQSKHNQPQEASLIVSRMANLLAGKPKCIHVLVAQDIVGFCGELFERYPANIEIAYESVCTLMKMSTFQHMQLKFTETSAIALIVRICEHHRSRVDPQALAIRECGAVTLRNLTLCVTEHFSEFYEEDDEESTVLRGVKGSEHLGIRKESVVDHELRDCASDATMQNLLFGVKYLQQEINSLTTWIKACSGTGGDGSSNARDAGGAVMDRILEEASAAITNLSTVRTLRLAMVQNHILTTFLQLCSSGIPTVQDICASTLHRFSIDEQNRLDLRHRDDDTNELVPSLLFILKQSDDALHCVRYECEKVSIVTNRLEPIRALGGATKCYRPTFKDPKWALHAIEANLSSRNMVPEIETKSLKRIGVPRPSACNAALFQRHDPRMTMIATLAGGNATTEAASPSSSCMQAQQQPQQQAANSFLHGFLLPVDSLKRQVKNLEQLDDPKTANAAVISSHERDSRQLQPSDSALHHKKFERHMRNARRNYRHNPSLLPVLTLL